MIHEGLSFRISGDLKKRLASFATKRFGGDISAAVRFILSEKLGGDTPASRAAYAIYSNVAPRLIQMINKVAHDTEGVLSEKLIGVISEYLDVTVGEKKEKGK